LVILHSINGELPVKHTSTFFTPPLAEVQARFAEWRKNKKHQRRIPEELWTAAVQLSFEHSIHKISTSLSLSYADLKKRVETTETPSTTKPSRRMYHRDGAQKRQQDEDAFQRQS